jgi:UDP-4-amino-4-deoxy-L-arabinose-oxoglutarate aminotransferase
MIGLGVGPGDEVIVPGLTFVCTAGTAVARGARVRFADIDKQTMCLSPEAVEAKVTEKTKAIIPVHFAGHPADIEGFGKISSKYGIPIVYDAAHAVGTKHLGKGVGGAGLASCYSFQSNKNMTTLGEGGAITTDDGDFAERVRGLKTFGYVYGGPQLRVTQIGFNYRMTKAQAAAGLTQLSKIDRVIEERLVRFQRLWDALAECEEIVLPPRFEEGHGCHLFVVRLDRELSGVSRDRFLRHLKEEWLVTCAIHYPAVWSWEAFANVDHENADTPETHRAVEEVFSLPVFPTTTFEDLDYVSHAVRETLAHLKHRQN